MFQEASVIPYSMWTVSDFMQGKVYDETFLMNVANAKAKCVFYYFYQNYAADV